MNHPHVNFDDLALYADDGAHHDIRLLARHVPIVNTPHPRWEYVSAVVVSDLWGGVTPTDMELDMVAS